MQRARQQTARTDHLQTMFNCIQNNLRPTVKFQHGLTNLRKSHYARLQKKAEPPSRKEYKTSSLINNLGITRYLVKRRKSFSQFLQQSSVNSPQQLPQGRELHMRHCEQRVQRASRHCR